MRFQSLPTELRVGVIGAARIVRNALILPSNAVAGVSVDVVGARDAHRAEIFANRNGIPRFVGGYEAVVNDPNIDAVYIPLPNSLHAEWAAKAIRAGKHVLCEKPFTSNAAQAKDVAHIVGESDVIVMQAFHYRYHPFIVRQLERVRRGEIGTLKSLNVTLCAPIPPGPDIRWDFDLAGGSMMDLGCYASHMVRTFGGAEPAVVSAKARTVHDKRLDRWMQAELEFASGIRGRITVGMWSSRLLALSLEAVGTRGTLRIFNPLLPHVCGRATLRGPARKVIDRSEQRPSYDYQLEAFRDAVSGHRQPLTGAKDGVATMTIVDAVYTAAGLPIRP